MRQRPFRMLFIPVLPVLLVATAALAEAQAAGRYQSKGSYRSQGQYHGSQNARPSHQGHHQHGPGQSTPWQPVYYPQGKYYQIRSPLRHVGNLSRSDLQSYGHGYSYGISPVIPGTVIYPSTTYVETAPQQQQQQAPPQVVIIQAPPPPAAPPPAAPVYTAPPPPPPPAAPVSNEPGEVIFAVHPASTEIYLNDGFVGTGLDLGGDANALVIKPGVYVLAALHPDFKAQRLVFGVTPGESTRIVVDLTDDRLGHRARVETGSEPDFILNR